MPLEIIFKGQTIHLLESWKNLEFTYPAIRHWRIKMSRSITLEFRGGAELLFDGVKQRVIELPLDIRTVRQLLVWIRDNVIRERPELFLQGSTVRPGILVLINNVDWELCGELEYEIAEKDTILFISTLHGG